MFDGDKKVTIRKAQRDCQCRGCDKRMERDVHTVVHTFSHLNRGQNILFCISCIEKMSDAIDQYFSSDVDTLEVKLGDDNE